MTINDTIDDTTEKLDKRLSSHFMKRCHINTKKPPSTRLVEISKDHEPKSGLIPIILMVLAQREKDMHHFVG
jgi:hypothetical protein